MANKNKRKYLDSAKTINFLPEVLQETQPYNSTNVITDQGTITEDKRSKWRKAQDALVKWVSSPKDPVAAIANVGGKTALAASVLANPAETLPFIAGSVAGRKVVDKASKKLTGKTTTELLSESRADLNPEIAEVVNPFNLGGGIAQKGIKSTSNRMLKAREDAYFNSFNGPRISVDQNGEIITPIVKSTPRYTWSTQKSLKDSNNNKKGLVGNIVNLNSSNIIYHLDDKGESYRRSFLKKMNLFFNKRYGYKKLPLTLAKDGLATRNAVQDRLLLHNTFVRGTTTDHAKDAVKFLQKNNIPVTDDNILIYNLTHFAGNTGYGRVDFAPGLIDNPNHIQLGPIYTSNMPGVAKGYAHSIRDGRTGKVGLVRRPVDFSSPYMEDWVINADFPYMYSKTGGNPSLFFSQYELPYAMKTGKSLKRAYFDAVGRPTLDYQKIINEFNNKYFKNDLMGERNTIYGDTETDYGETYKEYNDIMTLLGLVPKDITLKGNIKSKADEHYMENVVRAVNNQWRKASEEEYIKYVNPNGNFISGDNMPLVFRGTDALKIPRLKQEIINQILHFGSKSMQDKYYKSALKTYNTKRRETIQKEIIKQLPTIKDLQEFYTNQGFTPSTPTHMAFPSYSAGTGKVIALQSVNSDIEPRQHAIFVGPVGEKGLDFVRFINPDEITDYPNTHKGHSGRIAPWLSRKSKKYGGNIN